MTQEQIEKWSVYQKSLSGAGDPVGCLFFEMTGSRLRRVNHLGREKEHGHGFVP